jgi:hypothetical protein
MNCGILVNPYTDRTATVVRKKKKRLYALETADPVEGSDFVYTRQSPSGQAVTISDFVTPGWFHRGSKGPWDFTGGTKRPLQVLLDGYQLFLHDGSWDAIWASAEAKADGGAKAGRWNARHRPLPTASSETVRRDRAVKLVRSRSLPLSVGAPQRRVRRAT